tara:strand:+ start:39 stop:257 length:219 start_codon:yes stop_codon:yes gene_type:complete
MKRGLHFDKGYFSAYIFPIGIEILIEEGIQIGFILAQFELNISLGKNYTIFGDITEKAVKLEKSLNNNNKLN